MSKKIGDKGEQIVIKELKKEGIRGKIAKARSGYDIKAGRRLIEVKTTGQTKKQKTYFLLTSNEFLTACKNKNYWIYWVDTNKRKTIAKFSRNEILENVHHAIHYRVYLSKLKKKIKE